MKVKVRKKRYKYNKKINLKKYRSWKRKNKNNI